MKIPFERLIKIVLSLLVFECSSAFAFNSHFSKQYNELLLSVSNKSPKPQKCYFNDTITTFQQAIDIHFKTINNTAPKLNLSNSFREQQLEELTIIQAGEILYEQLYNVLIQMWQDFKSVYLQPKNTSSIDYYQNFADINGGAMILRISSKRIRTPSALLQDNNDRYMYTDEDLPLEIVIALKEEVSVDRIVIKSNEYYSSTIREFVFYGAFSLEKGQENWFRLVSAQAKNCAGEQEFRTVNKVIRFLKLKIISAYGDWKYFTMTQIKVYGSSLYAQAMSHKMKQSQNIVLQSDMDLSSISLYEDLKKMIVLARDGNRVIPQNNLMKYFFQQLQKLSTIEQQQILYMNDLTLKIQGLQNQTQEPQKQSEQIKHVKDSLFHLEEQISQLTSKDEEWPQQTLVFICVISSFLVTSAIFAIIFLSVFKQSKLKKSALTSLQDIESHRDVEKENEKKSLKKQKTKERKVKY